MCIMTKICRGFLYLTVSCDHLYTWSPISHFPKKLRTLNINPYLIKWLHSYLENRSQFVGVDGSDSHKLPVLSGIPQGFVLGPLLFIAYINEVTSIISNGNLFTLPTITLLTASLKTPTIQCREMQLSAERDLVLFNHLL